MINVNKVGSLTLILSFLIANNFGTSALAKEINKPKEPWLWRVDPKPGSIYSTYILGSYHIGKDCKLRSPAFEHAFNDAETVVFEVDSIHSSSLVMDSQRSLLTLIRQRGIPTNASESLKGILDPKTYQLLETKSDAAKFPIENVAHLKPWVFIFMYESFQMTNSEYKIECGMDSMISKMSQTKNKKIAGLESIGYQLDKLTDSYISMDLDKTLDTLEFIAKGKSFTEQSKDLTQQFDFLINSVDSGNPEDIESIIYVWCKEDHTDCESLLFTRNRNWIPKIEQLLEQKQDSLVVVGVGHLVGEQSVIELLKQKGYQVRRFQNNFRLSAEK